MIKKSKKEEAYISPAVGNEISCVMKDINLEFLKDNKKFERFLIDSLEKDNFSVLDIVSHSFQPKGYTFLALLSESHLAIHTYPEHNSIYFNMYSCRGPKDAQKTFERIKKELHPKNTIFLKENKIPVK